MLEKLLGGWRNLLFFVKSLGLVQINFIEFSFGKAYFQAMCVCVCFFVYTCQVILLDHMIFGIFRSLDAFITKLLGISRIVSRTIQGSYLPGNRYVYIEKKGGVNSKNRVNSKNHGVNSKNHGPPQSTISWIFEKRLC